MRRSESAYILKVEPTSCTDGMGCSEESKVRVKDDSKMFSMQASGRMEFPLAEQAGGRGRVCRENVQFEHGYKYVMPTKHLNLCKHYIIKHNEYAVMHIVYIGAYR